MSSGDLFGDHSRALHVAQPLVAERDPAVAQLEENALGNQAAHQRPGPRAARQSLLRDALDVGSVEWNAAEQRELA